MVHAVHEVDDAAGAEDRLHLRDVAARAPDGPRLTIPLDGEGVRVPEHTHLGDEVGPERRDREGQSGICFERETEGREARCEAEEPVAVGREHGLRVPEVGEREGAAHGEHLLGREHVIPIGGKGTGDDGRAGAAVARTDRAERDRRGRDRVGREHLGDRDVEGACRVAGDRERGGVDVHSLRERLRSAGARVVGGVDGRTVDTDGREDRVERAVASDGERVGPADLGSAEHEAARAVGRECDVVGGECRRRGHGAQVGEHRRFDQERKALGSRDDVRVGHPDEEA